MELYDIAIIGTGPAGISAAITATVRGKKVRLYGEQELSSKMRKAERIDNYPGLPHISGEELGKQFSRHLADLGIEVEPRRVTLIVPVGDKFLLQDGSGADVGARTVILAGGVAPAVTLPGEQELLGRGVSYCATCDGRFYQGKNVAVIASKPEFEAEAAFLAEYAKKVTYLPLYKEKPALSRGNVEIVEGKPKSIEGEARVRALLTDKGELPVDGVFILRESVLPDKLVPGLVTEKGAVVTDRKMATNIPGLFAAGDITGTPYQFIKAAGEGNVAALSAVKYLQ